MRNRIPGNAESPSNTRSRTGRPWRKSIEVRFERWRQRTAPLSYASALFPSKIDVKGSCPDEAVVRLKDPYHGSCAALTA